MNKNKVEKKMKLKNILLSTVLSLGLASCQNPFNTVFKDSSYKGVVVFCYTSESIPEEIRNEKFNELVNDGFEESVENWYKKRANEYGKNIDINLSKLEKEIKIPNEYLIEGKYPINILFFTQYIREKENLDNYDFIAIYYQKENDGISHEAYAYKNSSSFVMRYAQNSSEYLDWMDNSVFAHEFAHLIGASDKYNGENNVDSSDLMKEGGIMRLGDSVKITEPTAFELGWLN